MMITMQEKEERKEHASPSVANKVEIKETVEEKS